MNDGSISCGQLSCICKVRYRKSAGAPAVEVYSLPRQTSPVRIMELSVFSPAQNQQLCRTVSRIPVSVYRREYIAAQLTTSLTTTTVVSA